MSKHRQKKRQLSVKEAAWYLGWSPAPLARNRLGRLFRYEATTRLDRYLETRRTIPGRKSPGQPRINQKRTKREVKYGIA